MDKEKGSSEAAGSEEKHDEDAVSRRGSVSVVDEVVADKVKPRQKKAGSRKRSRFKKKKSSKKKSHGETGDPEGVKKTTTEEE